MNTKATIVWVSGYPAHYTRMFHRALEQAYPGLISFVYCQDARTERAYEQGLFPDKYSLIKPNSHLVTVSQLLQRIEPSALIVSGHYPRPQFYAALWGFARHIPVAYWCDTNLHDILQKSGAQRFARKSFFSWYFRRMHLLLYPGMRTLDYYVWAAGKHVSGKTFHLPYPFLMPEIRRETVTPNHSDVFRILFLGRLSPEKGIDNLIHACTLLDPELLRKTRFVVAGDGPDKNRLQRITADLNLTKHVEFTGAIPSDRVQELYRDASVFVLPSNNEPWGIVAAEALAANLPVIAPFWVGSTSDLVINGVTGIVLRDNSPHEIAKALSFLIAHPNVMRSMGTMGNQLVTNGQWGLDGACAGFARILPHLGVDQ